MKITCKFPDNNFDKTLFGLGVTACLLPLALKALRQSMPRYATLSSAGLGALGIAALVIKPKKASPAKKTPVSPQGVSARVEAITQGIRDESLKKTAQAKLAMVSEMEALGCKFDDEVMQLSWEGSEYKIYNSKAGKISLDANKRHYPVCVGGWNRSQILHNRLTFLGLKKVSAPLAADAPTHRGDYDKLNIANDPWAKVFSEPRCQRVNELGREVTFSSYWSTMITEGGHVILPVSAVKPFWERLIVELEKFSSEERKPIRITPIMFRDPAGSKDVDQAYPALCELLPTIFEVRNS